MTMKEIDMYFEAYTERVKNENKMQDFRTARILCMLANINRDKKKRPRAYTENDFMPREKKRTQTAEEMATICKAIALSFGGEVKNG